MTVIDDYLAGVTGPERAELERIRAIIRTTVPAAEEVKTYGMPGFKYKGKYLVSFAAFKDHLSLFPGALPADIIPKLEGYTLSKGTIQFSLDHSISDEIVQELLLRRVATIDGN